MILVCATNSGPEALENSGAVLLSLTTGIAGKANLIN